jgi:hypothetical protein
LKDYGGAAGKTDADFQTMKGSLENTLKALDTSFKNLSEALGTAFGPTVVATINQTAGAVNGIATAINEMPQPLKTATAEAVKLIAQFLLLQKAIQITIGLQTALAALTIQSNKLSVATTAGSSAFALYANNAAALAPKVTGVSAVLGNLKLAMLAIPGAGWTAAAIIGLGLLAKAVFDTNETFRNFVKNIGGVVANDFRSAVDGMADDAKDSAANIQKAYEELPPGLSPIAKFIRELFEGAFKDTSNAAETSATASSNAFGGRAAGGGGASKAADEAKRLAEELQRSVERGNDLFRQFSRQAVLLGTTSETERKRLQIQYEYQDRVREINELKDAEQKVNLMAVNDEIKRLQTLELQTEELKKQLELFYELAGLSMGGMLPGGAGAFRTDINLDPSDRAQQKIDEYKTKLTELQDPINMAQRGAQGIGDAFSSSFQGIITGTQTAQEALASFFQNIAKSFLDMATEIIAQMVIMYAFKQLLGLFGGGAGIAPSNNFSGAFSGTTASFNPSSFGMGLLPGRANGGPVSSGQTYMVGERGPELFVPGRSGTIVANDKMGGGNTNVVVNVDAKGSSVEGDEQGANQLGRVISAAVQSELIKQQRPGGILAR